MVMQRMLRNRGRWLKSLEIGGEHSGVNGKNSIIAGIDRILSALKRIGVDGCTRDRVSLAWVAGFDDVVYLAYMEGFACNGRGSFRGFGWFPWRHWMTAGRDSEAVRRWSWLGVTAAVPAAMSGSD
ncbi:hypothetical protein Dimus_035929 [Dionaea muscipula]